MNALLTLGSQLHGFEIWSEGPPGQPVTALIESSDRPRLDHMLARVIIEDWDAYRQNLRAETEGQDFFAAYHSYDQYIVYLEGLAADFPDLAQMIDLGATVQGRRLKGIRISGTPASMPAVFYHGVQHGNEITNGPVLVYIADYLLKNYLVDSHIQSLVDSTEWYIVPITNPDGHESGSRYNANRIDLNRDWGELAETGGFTQPETVALRDHMMAHPDIVWHVDFHTGVQMILWPWGQNSRICWDSATFSSVAGSLAASIPGYGTRGPIYSTLYLVHGDVTDYVYGTLGMLSYTVEVSNSYAAPTSLLPTYESRMRDLALHLVEWSRDCDNDGAPNPALDCLRPFSDTSLLISCMETGGPGRPYSSACNSIDWDNDLDVDMRDVARWMVRFGGTE